LNQSSQKSAASWGKIISSIGFSHRKIGSALGGLLHFEGGGVVSAGRAVVVGERRPELFVPDANGRIIPNMAQMGGGKAANFTVVQNISTPDADSFKSLSRRSQRTLTHQ